MRIVGNAPSGGKKPTTPTIGTATDGGTGTTVSVAFTPSTYIGKSTITYTATSSPGGLTGTSSGSPITVSGLTTGTAYTFTVVGTTNYGVSSAASAASNSVTPASPSSYESIATSLGNGSSGTITFSSIPSTYKSLQLRIFAKDTTASSSTIILAFRFNGDSGANYAYHAVYGTPAANGGFKVLSNSSTNVNASSVGATTSNVFGASIVDIIDYASTSKYKTMKTFSGVDSNGAANGQNTQLTSGLWLSTSAINSITIISQGNFASGTSIALYGIKG